MIPRNIAIVLMEIEGVEQSAEMAFRNGITDLYRSETLHVKALKREAWRLAEKRGLKNITEEMWAKSKLAWNAYAALNVEIVLRSNTASTSDLISCCGNPPK